MLCIFCLTKKPPGLEHVIPKSLGGTLTIDRVCGDCNSRLGSDVDHHLTNHLFAYFGRSNYGLGDEAQIISNIFGDGTMQLENETPVTVNVRGEEFKDEQGARLVPTPRLRPSVARVTNADGTSTVRAQFDVSQEHDLRSWLKAEYGRLGYALSDAEFEALYEQNITRVSSKVAVNHEMRIDTERFRVALIKIAYELAWYWLGDAWLTDSTSERIRDVVLGRLALNPDTIRGYVGFQPERWPLNMLDEEAMHSAAIIPTHDGVSLCVRVFTYFYAMIGVSEDTRRYFPSAQHSIELGRLMKFQRAAPREDVTLINAIQRLTQRADDESH